MGPGALNPVSHRAHDGVPKAQPTAREERERGGLEADAFSVNIRMTEYLSNMLESSSSGGGEAETAASPESYGTPRMSSISYFVFAYIMLR
mmetsp:Transcript_25582/g.35632  ORF Transcript_25582/g.35632 Transcript_25582/m.35632 type:complete len:91 (-) Transcript_25582:262-534(-)|eukprot:CAMPEP_0184501842 /NCGR_PEP_ID=MMETSP0113_2-20130426/48710_1 /TAXON_ID=91329 /ORGANISM="Norrisiella sphaerica, Strain BC52" /LENGTH=90 /DNA_ID=CAMNT_0026890747 /DNA_START=537 /DNA_END=809 /DNA_ORIENTATION=+